MSCLRFPWPENGRAGVPTQVLSSSRQPSKQRANVSSKEGWGDKEAKLSPSLPPSLDSGTRPPAFGSTTY